MRRCPILVIACLGLGLAASAQEQSYSIGALLSPTNIGATFNSSPSAVGMRGSGAGFHSVSVSADMTSAFLGRAKYPGLQISYNYDFIIAGWQTALGKSWLYAGPGIAVGFGDDWTQPAGHILGLNLQFGYDHLFSSRGIHLGVGVSPVLGYHLSRNEETGGLDMRIYNYGIIRAVMPQCRILWEIGRNRSELQEAPSRDARFEMKRRNKVLTFGIEASGLLELYDYHSYNYMSEFGREGDLSVKMITRLAAQVYVHGGVNIRNRANMSVMVGYQGVGYRTGEAVLSTELRATYLFEENRDGDRPLIFIQGGPGWDIMNESRIAGVMKFGGGYRMALSPSIKLDFLIGWQFMYLQPRIYEETYSGPRLIPNEYIGRNNEWIGTLTWGASLNF